MQPSLVLGVSWGGGPPGEPWDTAVPVLSLRGESGGLSGLPLAPGAVLGYRVLSAPGQRHCLGYTKVHGRDDREYFPCPWQADAERGSQCGACFAREDTRYMHDYHRSGIAPEGLKAYLAQPHWLYVATFAGGACKIGTASARSKWSRLAEQGAVQASYVARADDGRIVRVLEDLVTRELGLQQAVRAAAKAAGLVDPRPAQELAELHEAKAAEVRALLAGAGSIDGFTVVRESWRRPAVADPVLATPGLQAYAAELAEGEHGFTVRGMLGPCALAELAGSEVLFVADLSRIKGKRIVPGDYRSEVPAVQELLF